MLHPIRALLLCRRQLAVIMWLFTYVGAVFNGITILILGEQRGRAAIAGIGTLEARPCA